MRVFGQGRADEKEANALLRQLEIKSFAALTIEARWEIVRKTLILLLSVTLKRMAQ